jgi:hypothetical protein
VGEKASAQRLDNLMRECDVVYKRFSTRNEMRKEALENKFDRTFDIIRFNQQLTDIRGELEQNAIKQRTRIGDPTNDMNRLLEAFARQSLKVSGIPVMKTELTPEQLDAIFLTDGSNTFSGKTGKTRLEAFKWPFVIQRKEFQQERDQFERLCDQAIKEIDVDNSPSPETISDLLKQADAIDGRLDSLPLSDSQNVRAVETKWRKEAKAFIRELIRTLGNCSKLDSEKLSKYVFQGKTLGELIDHLDSKGLRFSHPCEQDANLYASIFFIMRYAYQEGEKSSKTVLDGKEDTPSGSEEDTALESKVRKKGDKRETGILRGAIDLLAQAVPERDQVFGEWKRSGNKITSDGSNVQCARIMFPTPIKGSYDLLIKFANHLSGAVVVNVPVGKHAASIVLNGKNGAYDALDAIDGKGAELNATVRRPSLFKTGESQLFAKVRLHGKEASIDVFLNGTQFIQWSGREDALSVMDHWKMPAQNRVGFGYRQSSVVLDAVQVRMLGNK